MRKSSSLTLLVDHAAMHDTCDDTAAIVVHLQRYALTTTHTLITYIPTAVSVTKNNTTLLGTLCALGDHISQQFKLAETEVLLETAWYANNIYLMLII